MIHNDVDSGSMCAYRVEMVKGTKAPLASLALSSVQRIPSPCKVV